MIVAVSMSNHPGVNISYARRVWLHKLADHLLPFFLIIIAAFSWVGVVGAEGNLTDIFYTKSFQGSWEVVNQYNWLGKIIQWIFTTFCLFGLFIVAYQRFVSLLYLAGRNTFDTIYDYKDAEAGNGWFGIKTMFTETFKGNRGTGMDAVIGLGYSLLPNVKYYSDFNPDKLANNNLKEEDSAVTYMLKTALPTIAMVFFFSMGFNGTLMRTYGMVANGFGAFAEKVADSNLEGYIKKKLNTGDSYRFTLAEKNTPGGKFGESIAQNLYGKVLSRMDIIDTDGRMNTGLNVETQVYQKILNSSIEGQTMNNKLAELANKGLLDSSNKATVTNNADIEALKYEIIINNNSTAAGAVTIPFKDLVPDNYKAASDSVGGKLHAHIIIRKDRVSETDFLVVPNKNGN